MTITSFLCYQLCKLFYIYVYLEGYIYLFLCALFASWVIQEPRWLYRYLSSHPSILLTFVFGPIVLLHVIWAKFQRFKKYSSKRIQTNKSKEPPINELLKLPATTLSAMIKRKEVKVETLTRICIETLREKNKDLNAVVATRFIDATLEAENLMSILKVTIFGTMT